MKKYFVLEHNGNVIMVDVKNIRESDNILAIDNDEESETYKTIRKLNIVEFGEFLQPIKIRQYKVDPETGNRKLLNSKDNFVLKSGWEYEKLQGGGFICYDIFSKKEEVDRLSQIEILYSLEEESKYFINFEDDDAARLWIEAMRDEYHVRGEQSW